MASADEDELPMPRADSIAEAAASPPPRHVDELRLRLDWWIATRRGPEGAHREAVDMLDLWHAGRGTPNGEAVAWRQALLLFFIAEGDTVESAAPRIPCSLSTAKRDRKQLEQVFGVSIGRPDEQAVASDEQAEAS